MASVKDDVVYAWLEEQLEAGKLSENEVLSIYNCKTEEEWLSRVKELAAKTGDPTPVEILSGSIFADGQNQTDSHC